MFDKFQQKQRVGGGENGSSSVKSVHDKSCEICVYILSKGIK